MFQGLRIAVFQGLGLKGWGFSLSAYTSLMAFGFKKFKFSGSKGLARILGFKGVDHSMAKGSRDAGV